MYELDKKKFGSFVASLRREQGLTQKELAQGLYISDKAVSKWETGVSIPDTALLVPLAQKLGVSVTELLTCQRMERGGTMDAQEVDSVVKAAITYAQQQPRRAYQALGRWAVVYAAALVLGAVGLLVNASLAALETPLVLPVLLAGIFGVYFVFAAPLQLPGYYDQNRIGGVMDGPFRLHLPGVSINNGNWPYLLRVGRVWSCGMAAAWPWLYALGVWQAPQLWAQAETYVLMAALLGGLFVPLYAAAKRHQEKKAV